ncbi:unnamed protein product, partial [Cylicostephanus goldi]
KIQTVDCFQYELLTYFKEWALDDVLLWLQACSLDDVASLLIGYDIRGTDLLTWDDNCLCTCTINQPLPNMSIAAQLGVTSASVREKILGELAAIRRKGPEDSKESEKKNGHRALFDIVKQSMESLQSKVPLPKTLVYEMEERHKFKSVHATGACCGNSADYTRHHRHPWASWILLEINDTPGEQFKSALMLTKLISDSYGAPIRFVVLRMKTQDRNDDSSVSY